MVLEGRRAPEAIIRREGYAYPLHDGDLVSILVVGGAGYIGSHTAKALVEAGQSPIVFDNLSSGTDYPTPDGTAVRDYVHVADLAQAHIMALRHLEGGRESFTANVGTGRGHSVKEVMASVERVSGLAVPHEEVARRPGDAPVLLADPSRIKTLLGWQPRYPELDTMVSHSWDWENRGG